MTTPDQVNGFFILPSGRSSPKGPPNAAIKVTLVSNSILPIATDVVAILDTGSSASAIDEGFAIDKNLDFVREVEGSSGLGFSRKVKIYKCGIFVKEFKQLIYADCGALPFKKAGKNFLVILGMDFIKNFDLEIKAYETGILLRRPTP